MNYRQVRVADKWLVSLPAPRVEAINWAKYERCRFDSLHANLSKGDVLYDVGAEWGDCAAAYAQIVGPENMVLFEPHPGVWANIKTTWEHNGLATPLRCFVGLVGREPQTAALDYDADDLDGWPKCAYADFWVHRSFRYIHEHAHSTQQTSLDAYADGAVPAGVTIDVEGAELEVLLGMEGLLASDSPPLVWVSVHPDLMEKDYGHKREDLHAYMVDAGYRSRLLGVDHEEHWLFWNQKRETPR